MDIFDLYMGTLYFMIAVGVIIPVCKGIHYAVESRQRRKEEARKAQEAQRKQEARKAAAENAAKTIQPEAPKRKRGRPRKNPATAIHAAPVPAPVATVKAEPTHAQAPQRASAPPAKLSFVGNNAFAGECVAFSGAIAGMTRAEAIRAVEANGGQAFENMPACTTLLVMGEHPGYYKRERANGWGVKMISAEAFKIRIMQPLTLSPDEFAATFAA